MLSRALDETRALSSRTEAELRIMDRDRLTAFDVALAELGTRTAAVEARLNATPPALSSSSPSLATFVLGKAYERAMTPRSVLLSAFFCSRVRSRTKERVPLWRDGGAAPSLVSCSS